jgi:hypothetical protein
VQSGLLLEASAARVDQVGAGVEQARELLGAAVLGGLENGVDRLLLRGRPRIELLEFAGEQLDGLVAAHLADLVNRSAIVVGPAGIEAVHERATDGIGIAGAGGIEHPLAVDACAHFSSPSDPSSRFFSVTSFSMLLASTALSP